MTGKLTAFCGNPRNHEGHDIQGTDTFCSGVGRIEDADVVVERYNPIVEKSRADLKEDSSEYTKVTIILEAASGVTSIVHIPKGSEVYLDVEYMRPQLLDGYIRPSVPSRINFSVNVNPIENGQLYTIETVEPEDERPSEKK